MPFCLPHGRLLRPVHLPHGQNISFRLVHGSSNLPQPLPAVAILTPEHETEARKWLTTFQTMNVNKLSTKVAARFCVDAPWIPLWARAGLVRCPYYVKSTHSLLMTSSVSRSQASNVDDVLAKLHALVAQTAASLITKSPTEEQRGRVASLQKVDNARKRLQKDKRSAAKKSRSSKNWD